MTEPIISIGMPAFNSERWLASSIESILEQTFTNIELIISDNASTDNTADRCEIYAQQDDRVRYYRNSENIGVTENYNAVVKHARGKYFKWASTNDYCDKTMLQKCFNRLESEHDAVICYTGTRLLYDDGKYVDYNDGGEFIDTCAYLRFRSVIESMRLNNIMNGLIRTDVLKTTMLHGSYLSSDLPLMGELALRGNFVMVPEFLFYRRIGESASTNLKTHEEKLDYFDPHRRTKMLYQEWKLLSGYFRAVSRVSLPLNDKLRLYG